jgi:site-specific DNA recombinase
MLNTNGHGPKRAILYSRVSTDEQARTGYSLAQQLEALREYAAREGYEVLEEVSDPGQSGASLERPGMDRVRDLVSAGGVSVVLAQDRDRFAREPAYLYLLREEFAEGGTVLQALNDRGDDSPEGQLTDGILDQIARYERSKIAERSRRGKLRKARQGEIIANRQPVYGFRFTADRKGYEVDPERMPIVHRIFEMVASGTRLLSIKKAFDRESIPTPSSGHPTGGDGRFWSQAFLKKCIMHDAYKPHTPEELMELLPTDVADKLDADRCYGVWWFGRQRHTYKQVSETTPDGVRRYRKSKKSTWVPQDQWIGVPVPDCGIPRELVEAARAAVKYNRRAAKASERTWELSGGIFRCGCCGRALSSVPVGGGKRRRYYYRCPNRATNGPEACRMRRYFRAETMEARAFEAVCWALTHPEELRADLDRMIELHRKAAGGDPDRESRHWLRRLEEADNKRSRFQHAYAEGIISLEDLGSRLGELKELEDTARRELRNLQSRQERMVQLKHDRDVLLEDYASQSPQALDYLTPEQRHHLYKMLKLRLIASEDGTAALEADALPVLGGSKRDTLWSPSTTTSWPSSRRSSP